MYIWENCLFSSFIISTNCSCVELRDISRGTARKKQGRKNTAFHQG